MPRLGPSKPIPESNHTHGANALPLPFSKQDTQAAVAKARGTK